MPLPKPDKPLIVIVGPTAVGKTELSIQLAERLGGEIVSADSRLFYRGMDIGTAKPNPAEQKRVPHHLIDVANPDEVWSLALFQEAACRIIDEIHFRQRLPFLVGGTGQYIRAVLEGWQPPAQEPDPAMRHVLEKWAAEIGPFELHRRLALLDLPAAKIIDPTNVRRTIRALEVIFNSGRRFSEQRQKNVSKYSYLMIGLIRPRADLYARVDARIESMIENGFVEEVQSLMARGYTERLAGMAAIGYGEIVAYLKNEVTLEEAIIQMKRQTRRFVRRQTNWFKENDPKIHWFQVDGRVVDRIEDFIESGQGWIIPASK
jgi:tRNA dimethylallyltransferase